MVKMSDIPILLTTLIYDYFFILDYILVSCDITLILQSEF